MRNIATKVLAVLFSIAVLWGICGLIYFLTNRPSTTEQLASELASACSGEGSLKAAAFTGSSPHPIVISSKEGEIGGWSNQITGDWLPASIGEVQLVACFEWEDIVLEVCPYMTGPNITRYRTDLIAHIVEARTGNQVASHTFEGADARQCMASEDYDTTVLYGKRPSYDDIEGWLGEFVEGRSESGSTVTGTLASPPPEPKEVSVYCGYQGNSPQYLEANQMVSLYWRWGADNEEYRQDYINAATFFLNLDGGPVEISTADRSLHTCEEGGLCVTWQLEPMLLDPGSHLVSLTVILHYEITDGFDLDNDGRLDVYGPSEWTAEPPCEIVAR